MKITLNSDGTVAFETESVEAAVALARALRADQIANVEVTPAEQVPVEPASSFIERVSDALPDAAPVSEPSPAVVLPHDDDAPPHEPVSVERAKRAAAREAGLSLQHYVTWEYLVDHDNRRGGTTIDHVMRAFKINRGAATQRLCVLVEKGYAVRTGKGHYVPATP